jgi:malonyl-CoA O-methyltransferase
MLERLDLVKIQPRAVLDAGSGPGSWTAALARRYPGARIVALDSSHAMLLAGRPRWWQRIAASRRVTSVCGDFRRLPFAAGLFQLVWCNMALHWVSDPLQAFRELHRSLAVEGLLMFSTLGPDTLKELRAAAGAHRVHTFIDMHDLGDMLVAAGYADPVMDMEMIRVAYAQPEQLLADLRASGQTLARADRGRGLAGKGFDRTLRSALLAQGTQATYEIVYGHAWKVAPRKDAEGRAIVQVHRTRSPGR